MHVLIADDQPRVRFALRVMLEKQLELHIAAEVADAQSLLTRLQDEQPDAVLLDWQLPGLAQIGSVPALYEIDPELTVIVFSGRPEARQAALDAGATAFVSKIDPPEMVLNVLRELE